MSMGREVRHASLYSEKVWQELGVTEGSLVEVGLTNDVTPKIYRVVSTPTIDPSCEHCEHEPVSVRQARSTGSVLRQAQEPVSDAFVDNDEKMRKVIAIVGAVAITLLMIYFFGLLGPAVFGLLAGGILKG